MSKNSTSRDLKVNELVIQQSFFLLHTKKGEKGEIAGKLAMVES